MKINPNPHQILIVEDDPNDLELLQRTLRACGQSENVWTAANAESALAYLFGRGSSISGSERPLPTVIFLDLNLPGKSGFEVLTSIRQDARLGNVPVIVLTGSKYTLDIYRAYELGADSYLVKPVHSKALDEVLKSLSLEQPIHYPVSFELPSLDRSDCSNLTADA